MQISHNYTYTPSLPSFPLLPWAHLSRSSWSTKGGSLCHVQLLTSSPSYTRWSMHVDATFSILLTLSLPQCPQAPSPYLCLLSSPANRFISIIFLNPASLCLPLGSWREGGSWGNTWPLSDNARNFIYRPFGVCRPPMAGFKGLKCPNSIMIFEKKHSK